MIINVTVTTILEITTLGSHCVFLMHAHIGNHILFMAHGLN